MLALSLTSMVLSTQGNLKIKQPTNRMNNLSQQLKRPLSALAVLGLLFAASPVAVMAAGVGGQVQFRSIKMSDSGVSGGTITTGVGSGTDVRYRVSFTAATSYTIKGLVVDFCSGTNGTPFISDSNCPAPAAFTVGATPTIDTAAYTDNTTSTPVVYTSLGTGWTASSLNSGQTFTMTNATGFGVTSGTAYSFEIQGVTNTSELGTFYARLVTYTDDTAPAAYTHAAPGTWQDYGGFALSTAYVIQVTAKVQETLTFCVSGSTTPPPGAPTPPTSCTPTSSLVIPAITLGHGTNNTLDTSAVDTGTIYTITSTNALHGVAIRMHNSNTCGGLSTDNGTTCAIPAANAGAATSGAITAGTAAFGMHCYDSTNASINSVGAITCDTNYNDGTISHYAMDTTSIDNVVTTYGDRVSYSTAPVNGLINQYDFAATAAATTPAGIYTANLAMIATGTF